MISITVEVRRNTTPGESVLAKLQDGYAVLNSATVQGRYGEASHLYFVTPVYTPSGEATEQKTICIATYREQSPFTHVKIYSETEKPNASDCPAHLLDTAQSPTLPCHWSALEGRRALAWRALCKETAFANTSAAFFDASQFRHSMLSETITQGETFNSPAQEVSEGST